MLKYALVVVGASLACGVLCSLALVALRPILELLLP